MGRVTAGRDQLGDFAPEFAHLNDDVLFGEVWEQSALDIKTKCIITVVSLVSSGITDSSLVFHLKNAKAHGVSKAEIAAIITHVGMYVGWPKAWAAFRLAKDVWTDESEERGDELKKYESSIFFPVGNPNDAFSQYFIGKSYLAPVSTGKLPIHNVTFEPGCRNNWHVHNAKSGGGQVLICVGGKGIYREWGCPPVVMTPGSVVEIPAGVKHWHGATKDGMFSHLAFEIPGEQTSTEWLEPVDDEQYNDALNFKSEEK